MTEDFWIDWDSDDLNGPHLMRGDRDLGPLDGDTWRLDEHARDVMDALLAQVAAESQRTVSPTPPSTSTERNTR